jgi:flagellar motor switch/type III secretory pathway protein FliN
VTAPATTLDRTNLTHLIEAVGSVPSDLVQPEFSVYDWKACRVFAGDAWAQLSEAAGGLAKAYAAVFADVCQGDVEATVASMSQRYASEVVKDFGASDNAGYFLPIRSEPGADVCGFLAIPPETAREWGKFLLGETAEKVSEAESEPLSELEETLIYGTSKVLVDKVRLMDASLDVTASDEFAMDQLPVKWPGTESLLSVTIGIKPPEADATHEVTLVLPCYLFGPLVGWDPQEKTQAEGLETIDCSEAIMASIHRVTVPLTPLLGTASLKLTELMSLRVDDVLVLDQPAHQMIDIHFANRTAFRGVPGKQQRQQCVLITDACTQPT